MLTADLVHARRRGGDLLVTSLDETMRDRAVAIASAYAAVARAHVGLPRQNLQEAWRGVTVSARERKLADGLGKLVLDGCRFEEAAGGDPAALRRALFERATAARRAGSFDRSAILAEVAGEQGLTAEAAEAGLFADLPSAHRLVEVAVPSADALVAGYDAAQAQAVLLRAVRVRARVRCATADGYRWLFRRLKFLQLLFTIEACDEGYLLTIDGPFSLFDAVTKYGLKLALAYPSIAAADEWSIDADVLWGKDRRPLRFRRKGTSASLGVTESPLPEPTTALLERLQALHAAGSPWTATPATSILDLPGVGLCVPDVTLQHAHTGAAVHVELLGFWSRDAVWRRIELARAGLPAPVVFAVGKHLRVSEAALDDADVPAALYVYAQTPNARALLERADAVAARSTSVAQL